MDSQGQSPKRGSLGEQVAPVPLDFLPELHPPNTVPLAGTRQTVSGGDMEVKTKELKLSVLGKHKSKASEPAQP